MCVDPASVEQVRYEAWIRDIKMSTSGPGERVHSVAAAMLQAQRRGGYISSVQRARDQRLGAQKYRPRRAERRHSAVVARVGSTNPPSIDGAHGVFWRPQVQRCDRCASGEMCLSALWSAGGQRRLRVSLAKSAWRVGMARPPSRRARTWRSSPASPPSSENRTPFAVRAGARRPPASAFFPSLFTLRAAMLQLAWQGMSYRVLRCPRYV